MPGWLFASLRGYDRAWLRGDLIAGLTVWAVLVPEALAYASIAGVSPSSASTRRRARCCSTPRSAARATWSSGRCRRRPRCRRRRSADVVAQGEPGFAAVTAALAVTTGIAALLAGLLRLGFLAEVHLRAGAEGLHRRARADDHHRPGPELFGVEKGGGDFFEKLGDVVSELGDTSGTTLAVGALSLAVVLGLRRSRPPCPARWSRSRSACSR